MPQEELNTTNGQQTLTWHVYTRARRRHAQSPGPQDLSRAVKNTFTSLKEQKLYSLFSYHDGIMLKITTKRPNGKILTLGNYTFR